MGCWRRSLAPSLVYRHLPFASVTGTSRSFYNGCSTAVPFPRPRGSPSWLSTRESIFPYSRQACPTWQSSRPAAASNLRRPQAFNALQKYTACDISDALIRLKVPKAGHIADLNQYHRDTKETAVIVAPVSTFLFKSKDELALGDEGTQPASNLPDDSYWVDNAVPGTFAVLQQPASQVNAICGGIMTLRMKVLGIKGIIVVGRVRDLAELRSTEIPVLARGTSTIGSSGGSLPWAMQVPLDIDGVIVRPGDLAVSDPTNGVVIVPRDMVDKVLELLPQLVSVDNKVKGDVAEGAPAGEAFIRHRGYRCPY